MNPNITELLQQLADHLERYGEESWAAALRRLRNDFHFDPEGTKPNIRRLFGGMGSLNDIVLQNADGPLRAENDELDRLRTALYEACRG